MTDIEKLNLERVDEQIYYTTHDPKNKNALPIVIFFSVICIIFKNPLFWESVVWVIYYLYCDCNNQKWKNMKRNIEHREFLLNYRKKIIEGKINFPEEM